MNPELMDKLNIEETAKTPGTVETVPEVEALSKEELLRQFQYVKRMTKTFLVLTWIALIGYFMKNGMGLIEWAMAAVFLIVTVQLWTIGVKK